MQTAVVLTRARGDNDELAGRLRARGLSVIEYPCIELRVVEAAGVDREVDAVAFTSRMGVRGFFQNRLDRGFSPRIVGVVGAATATELLGHEWKRPTHVPAKATAEALAEMLAADLHAGETLLWPCGNLAAAPFPDLLAQIGVGVIRKVVYVNEPAAPAHLDQEWGVVVLSSPSAVSSFLASNAVETERTFVTIGPRTTEAARLRGIARIVEADRADVESLDAAVMRAIARI